MNTNAIDRRTFLRGVGVSMALPWLESRNVWGAAPSPSTRAGQAPVRLAVVFSGNGFHSKEWWAKGEGKAMELGKVLAPLHDLREKLVFIRGLYNADELPVVLLGGAGGRVQGGRILDYRGKPDRQMCRLYLAMLEKLGVSLPRFGDADRALAEL